MTLLITGTSSGIGQYLNQYFPVIETASRHSQLSDQKQYDAIIHCAFDNSIYVSQEAVYDYYQNNLKFLEKLLRLNSKKFIYFSSINVYDFAVVQNEPLNETSLLSVKETASIYNLFKLLAEEIIKKNTDQHLILRCSAMLGQCSRKNSLIKILFEPSPTLTLSSSATFNYIAHEDIARFLSLALKNDYTGIFNLVANDNISLKAIADYYQKQVKFGHYCYTTSPLISNQKILNLCDYFNKASFEVVNQFFKNSMQGITRANHNLYGVQSGR